MGLVELIFLCLSVSVDAFAVSVSGALCDREHPMEHGIIAMCYFGFFQYLMPFLGGLLGKNIDKFIGGIDSYIVFGLLAFIGGRMLYSEFSNKEEKKQIYPFHMPNVLILAVATSLDAFAVGLSLKLMNYSVIFPAIFMGVTTGIMSFIGVILGQFLGKIKQLERVLNIVAALIIILIGVKVLIGKFF